MKYIITIPATISKGKVTPAKHKLTEAFNQAQAERRASGATKAAKNITVEPLDEWLAKIETI